MTSDYLRKRIGGAILSFAVLAGVALATSLTAQAQNSRYPQYPAQQDRDWNRNRDRNRDQDRDRNRNGDYRNGRGGGYGNIYRIAQEQGYRDGLYTGESDSQRGQNYNPQRSHYYKSGTDGYNSSYGNKDAYRQAFRDGFLRGYNEGFRRFRGNNRGNNRRGGSGSWYPF